MTESSTERPALRVVELRKAYGPMVAVEALSFAVHAGEIVGLLGPNGAGKTTAINMILGVLQPTAGNVWIDEVRYCRIGCNGWRMHCRPPRFSRECAACSAAGLFRRCC